MMPCEEMAMNLPSLPDISGRFKFKDGNRSGHFFKEASGYLGTPGDVATHRDINEQRAVSAGTGEHAGHLIGIQFGAPGDLRNLGLQNPNMNTFAPKPLQEAFQGSGGNYLKLEAAWSELLKLGYKIHVTVTDKYRANENRPYTRSVQWTEHPPHGEATQRSVEFVNFTSPQSRAQEH
jgi:DNA/RNA non-specific endonuclease